VIMPIYRLSEALPEPLQRLDMANEDAYERGVFADEINT